MVMPLASNLLRPKVISSVRSLHLSPAPLLAGPRIWPNLHYPPTINTEGKDFARGYDIPRSLRRGKPIGEPLMEESLANLRNVYPEFLPNWDPTKRNLAYNRLERTDMLARRSVIDIPEFYSGSIMAVTVSDPNAAGKLSKFVGICIMREEVGLRASFTLRNIIDREGVEIKYDLYNPTIRSIEVLKLEKWIDDDISYIRDALPEYSTIPFDMAPEVRRVGQEVTLFTGKIKMGPQPWSKKWWHPAYRHLTKNIEEFKDIYHWPQKNMDLFNNPNRKYDLGVEYRMHTPEEIQREIWEEVQRHDEGYSSLRRKQRREQLMKR